MPTHSRFRLLGLLVLVSPAALSLGCTGELSGSGAGQAPPGAMRGELVSYVATRDDGTSDEYYVLRRGDDEVRLAFDADPDLTSGETVDVWASREGDRLRVKRFEVVRPAIEPIEQPLLNAPPYQPRSFVMAIVNVGGTPATPLTMDAARTKLFGLGAMSQPSIRQYYVEASYGRQDIAGDVAGPFDYPTTTCATSAMATALRSMIPGTYNHYLWYMQPRIPSCGFSGLASGGSPTRPARDTWYNASSGCVVLMQEPGHNFGMRHSSFMKCPGAPFADTPEGTCMHNEYGDRYDPMGGGCRHMNSYQKTYQGWLDKCNMIDVGADGTFTLLPLELPCDGIQSLAIKMPKTRPFSHSGGGGSAATDMLDRYIVELRAPIGIDKGLGPIVQIRVGGDISERNRRGLHTWFLDMNPSTTTLDGLAPGATFADPTGFPKITVVSVDGTKASVKVEFEGGGSGAPTCIDGTAFTGSGPGPESCAAAPAVPSGAPPVLPDGGAVNMPPPSRDGGGTPTMRLDARPADAGSSMPTGGAGGSGQSTGGASGGQGTGGVSGTMGKTPDAASPGSVGTGGSGGSSGPVVDNPPGVGVKGGCGCFLGGQDRPAPLALMLMALLLWRRRRR
jgi:MYXO-CTERM domain-containing protein